VGVLSAWVSSATEDVSLLTNAYLPELLLVTLVVFVSLAARVVVSRVRHSSR
jgi:hypothetical protein